jgi:hypothetical protein
LQTSSLERYSRTYKLSELPVYNRDALVPLIVQHLTELVSLAVTTAVTSNDNPHNELA